jgi:uncharacterized protein YcgL (UPF0745 family)
MEVQEEQVMLLPELPEQVVAVVVVQDLEEVGVMLQLPEEPEEFLKVEPEQMEQVVRMGLRQPC